MAAFSHLHKHPQGIGRSSLIYFMPCRSSLVPVSTDLFHALFDQVSCLSLLFPARSEHIKLKLKQHDLIRIYPNLEVIASNFQVRGLALPILSCPINSYP